MREVRKLLNLSAILNGAVLRKRQVMQNPLSKAAVRQVSREPAQPYTLTGCLVPTGTAVSQPNRSAFSPRIMA